MSPAFKIQFFKNRMVQKITPNRIFILNKLSIVLILLITANSSIAQSYRFCAYWNIDSDRGNVTRAESVKINQDKKQTATFQVRIDGNLIQSINGTWYTKKEGRIPYGELYREETYIICKFYSDGRGEGGGGWKNIKFRLVKNNQGNPKLLEDNDGNSWERCM
ncbi:MAG: hypothetical protein ACKO6Q_03655 [Bacteroidota bacterium]